MGRLGPRRVHRRAEGEEGEVQGLIITTSKASDITLYTGRQRLYVTGGRIGRKRRPGFVLSRPPVGCCCGCRSLITPSLCIASSLARFFLTPGADCVCFFALALTLYNLASLLMTSKNKN